MNWLRDVGRNGVGGIICCILFVVVAVVDQVKSGGGVLGCQQI